MGFAERFIAALGSRNLQDDAQHRALDVVAASALAGGLGSLLWRVKYESATLDAGTEGRHPQLATLLRIWEGEVRRKGEARRWIRVRSERDVATAYVLYRRVAQASLAHWLDGACPDCRADGVAQGASCAACKGSGRAEVKCAGGFERERVRDMIDELNAIADAHAGRAMARLKKSE